MADIWDQQNTSSAMHFCRNLKDEVISFILSTYRQVRLMGFESRQGRLLHFQIYSHQSLGGSTIKLSWLQSHLEGFYPKKFMFFLWELNYTCLNTLDQLLKRSPWMALSPQCCSLSKSDSVPENIFNQCPFCFKDLVPFPHSLLLDIDHHFWGARLVVSNSNRSSFQASEEDYMAIDQ